MFDTVTTGRAVAAERVSHTVQSTKNRNPNAEVLLTCHSQPNSIPANTARDAIVA